MTNTYDPDLLLAQARIWRQRAETARQPERNAYLSRALEHEGRVQRSIHTPPISHAASLAVPSRFRLSAPPDGSFMEVSKNQGMLPRRWR